MQKVSLLAQSKVDTDRTEISLLENNIPVLPRAHPAEWGIPLLKEKSLFFLDKQPKRTPFIV